MEIALKNKEKVSMCMIGKHYFTYDEPGPKDIDLDSLSQSELNQLIYNARRGVLAVGDPKKLLEYTKQTPAAAKSYSTPQERPIKQEPVQAEDAIEEDLKPLRELLRGSVNAIKRKVGTLTPGRVRKLLELEIQGKNRKGLKTHLNELLAKHAETVMGQVGDEDIGDKITAQGVAATTSPQVTDVVESEVEQVVMNPLGDQDG